MNKVVPHFLRAYDMYCARFSFELLSCVSLFWSSATCVWSWRMANVLHVSCLISVVVSLVLLTHSLHIVNEVERLQQVPYLVLLFWNQICIFLLVVLNVLAICCLSCALGYWTSLNMFSNIAFCEAGVCVLLLRAASFFIGSTKCFVRTQWVPNMAVGGDARPWSWWTKDAMFIVLVFSLLSLCGSFRVWLEFYQNHLLLLNDTVVFLSHKPDWNLTDIWSF